MLTHPAVGQRTTRLTLGKKGVVRLRPKLKELLAKIAEAIISIETTPRSDSRENSDANKLELPSVLCFTCLALFAGLYGVFAEGIF
jgi:hypothetical protein